MRYATVSTAGLPPQEAERRIAAYLPENYSVVRSAGAQVLIAGHDHLGWTLDAYVLPRLASGLYFGHETTEEEAREFIRR